MDFPIDLTISELRPLDLSPRGIGQAIVDNMYGTVQSGLLDADLLSQTDGPLPVYEGVQPFGIKSGNVTIQSAPSVNRNQIFQNKDGVVALLDDAYHIRDAVILPEGLVSVDWNTGSDFICILSGNRQSTFYMFNSKAGMEIDLLLVNNGTNQTVYAWDPLIMWPTGTPPTMPAATAGSSSLMKVNLVNVNGVIYGESSNFTAGSPIGGIDLIKTPATPPTL
jgi:hypothetical protein